jgi:CRP/FNR family transcriptional regulator, cyclic AMP receptor protein
MISPELLRRYPYFAQISDGSLKEIAMMADEATIPAGMRVFNEGDPANSLYVILKGEVNIQYVLGDGQLRTVDTLVDGDLLVWSALVEPYKTTAVGTTTKETRVVKVNAGSLRKLCDKDPQVGYRLMLDVAKLLANRLEGARIQLASLD